VSPTVFRGKGFRFFFFSREETRIHIHVHKQNGEAKFWIDPQITLAQNFGLSEKELRQAEELIRENLNGIKDAWFKHFGS